MAKKTRVALLDLGSLAMPECALFWGTFGSEVVRFPVYGVLIDHADGLFLYDSGFDKAHLDSLMPGNARQTERQTLPAQLALAGFSTDRVSHVVNSHYHVDHVGGNRLCGGATTVCHACEMEAAANPPPYEMTAYSDMSFAPGLRGSSDPVGYADDIYTRRFETLRGDQEIAKGVTLIETPGHTDGHYSLLVTLADRRPMLFTADACYTPKSLAERRIANSHVDVRRSYASLDRLEAVARDNDAEFFFGHDPDGWDSWRPAPYFYS